MLSIFRSTTSDGSFGIFKRFLIYKKNPKIKIEMVNHSTNHKTNNNNNISTSILFHDAENDLI